MENTEIPENYSGIINLYMSSDGLEIEKEKLSKIPIGSILVFIVENGELLGQYVEKCDKKNSLVYSYHYS